MEDCTSNAVTAFAAVELSQRGSALGFVVNIGQRVQGFIDTTELCNGLRQRVGRSPTWSVRMMPVAGTRRV